jgi:hypothetical protein
MSWPTPTLSPEWIRDNHCAQLARGFERVNTKTTDSNYFLRLDGWNIGAWMDNRLKDAGTIEAIVRNPEVSELTEKAISIFSRARKQWVEPEEFNEVIERLREVLK